MVKLSIIHYTITRFVSHKKRHTKVKGWMDTTSRTDMVMHTRTHVQGSKNKSGNTRSTNNSRLFLLHNIKNWCYKLNIPL